MCTRARQDAADQRTWSQTRAGSESERPERVSVRRHCSAHCVHCAPCRLCSVCRVHSALCIVHRALCSGQQRRVCSALHAQRLGLTARRPMPPACLCTAEPAQCTLSAGALGRSLSAAPSRLLAASPAQWIAQLRHLLVQSGAILRPSSGQRAALSRSAAPQTPNHSSPTPPPVAQKRVRECPLFWSSCVAALPLDSNKSGPSREQRVTRTRRLHHCVRLAPTCGRPNEHLGRIFGPRQMR